MLAGKFAVPAELQGGDDRSRHDLGIRHLALGILIVMQDFEHIVAQALDCYNLGVHVISSVSFGLGNYNSTRFHMDYLLSPPPGGNLG